MKHFAQGQTFHISDVDELNASTAPAFRDEIRAALKPEYTAVDIDLSDTKFIDSSGLGALIAIQKTMAMRQGMVRIVNPTKTVMQILELTRLHRVLEIVRR